MKKLSVFLILAVVWMALAFQSCQKNELDHNPNPNGILPERFKVDIPNSLSSVTSLKSTEVDTVSGNLIYFHLRSFIWIGEHAADLVGGIILAIVIYDLDHPMSFSFTSNADGRVKQVDVVEDAMYQGQMWQYKLTITDQGELSNETGNTAMQIYWNNHPIKGIAILNPYHIDRTIDPIMQDVMYRVDYSEAGEMGYAYQMIVSITGLPLADPLDNPYSMSAMKMFVGRNGDVISVYGNSEHPNAHFFNGDVGFDWAYVASAQRSEDIAVAEVGLPSNTLDSDDRYTILVENSIENVFTQQIYDLWPWIDSTSVQTLLYNTQAPGFFNHTGFIQGGTSPGPQYNPLLNIIAGLKPYNPAEIHELEIGFGE